MCECVHLDKALRKRKLLLPNLLRHLRCTSVCSLDITALCVETWKCSFVFMVYQLVLSRLRSITPHTHLSFLLLLANVKLLKQSNPWYKYCALTWVNCFHCFLSGYTQMKPLLLCWHRDSQPFTALILSFWLTEHDSEVQVTEKQPSVNQNDISLWCLDETPQVEMSVLPGF